MNYLVNLNRKSRFIGTVTPKVLRRTADVTILELEIPSHEDTNDQLKPKINHKPQLLTPADLADEIPCKPLQQLIFAQHGLAIDLRDLLCLATHVLHEHHHESPGKP